MLNVFFLAQIATANASLGSAAGISSSNSPLRSGSFTFQFGEDGTMKMVPVHHDELKPKIVKQHLGKASKTYLGALKKHTWGRIALKMAVGTYPISVCAAIYVIATATTRKPDSMVPTIVMASSSIISMFAGSILAIFQFLYATTPFRVMGVLYIVQMIVLLVASKWLNGYQFGPLLSVGLQLIFYITGILVPFLRLQGWSKVSFFYD